MNAQIVKDEIRDSNRTGGHFLFIAAFCILLAAGFHLADHYMGTVFSLLAAGFCGAFAVAWFFAAAALRIPFLARWTIQTALLPARLRPVSGLAAVFWFFIFVGGGIVLVRAFGA